MIPAGAIADGMRDAMNGDDTPEAQAFRMSFVCVLSRLNRRAVKG